MTQIRYQSIPFILLPFHDSLIILSFVTSVSAIYDLVKLIINKQMVKKKSCLSTKIILPGKLSSQMETLNFTPYVHARSEKQKSSTLGKLAGAISCSIPLATNASQGLFLSQFIG
jgi:hypothetical protein